MTVSYTAEVATCKGFGCFWKLLFRWKGSIYKLLWPELILYSCLYFSLSFLYRIVLNEDAKRRFEKVSLYCDLYADLIPVTFILGFYISIVLKRWWDQFMSIPWPDPIALFVSANIHGQDERGRLMRRTIMRYINLSLVMTLTCISPRVKKRFPTFEHFQEAGILLPNEKYIIEDMNSKTPQYPKYWMPLVWASSIITRARKEGRIRDDFAVKTLIDELCSFRGHCGGLFIYDWISIPLVYTQVVTLAVYTFFLTTIMGRQYLDPQQKYENHDVDLYIPIFTFLQFFFYMGWLKVAETLVNPFGEDDDDFEMNWLIDRNIQVSYLIVDEMHQDHPELIRDQYWDEIMPPELPYTTAAQHFRRAPPKGSAADLRVDLLAQSYPPPPSHLDYKPTIWNSFRSIAEKDPDFVPLGGDMRLSDDLGIQIEVKSSSEKESLPVNILSRQTSIDSQGLRKRPSMLSMFQRLFSKESNQSGSELSLQSNGTKQSMSKLSNKSNASFTPMQEDIFKMSDISLNNTGRLGEFYSVSLPPAKFIIPDSESPTPVASPVSNGVFPPSLSSSYQSAGGHLVSPDREDAPLIRRGSSKVRIVVKQEPDSGPAPVFKPNLKRQSSTTSESVHPVESQDKPASPPPEATGVKNPSTRPRLDLTSVLSKLLPSKRTQQQQHPATRRPSSQHSSITNLFSRIQAPDSPRLLRPKSSMSTSSIPASTEELALKRKRSIKFRMPRRTMSERGTRSGRRDPDRGGGAIPYRYQPRREQILSSPESPTDEEKVSTIKRRPPAPSPTPPPEPPKAAEAVTTSPVAEPKRWFRRDSSGVWDLDTIEEKGESVAERHYSDASSSDSEEPLPTNGFIPGSMGDSGLDPQSPEYVEVHGQVAALHSSVVDVGADSLRNMSPVLDRSVSVPGDGQAIFPLVEDSALAQQATKSASTSTLA